MSKIRRAQPEDIFDIANILIDEMHSEIGVGEVNKSKVLEYVNDVDLERKNKLFTKVYKPFGFIYLGGELNSIGRS
jgi:hypothetical protein